MITNQMDREKVISGLKYTTEMFLFDPATGYTKDPDDLNAADRITFDACIGAIALLKEQQERIEHLQPKKGKWLEYAGDQKCSVCGSSYSDLFPEYDRTPFCPHCGAKMEEGDKSAG